MSWEVIRLIFDVIYAVVIGSCAIYVFITERKRVTEEKLDTELNAIHGTISGHDTRITRLESGVEHFPTHDDIGNVYEELRNVSGGVQLLNGEMKALRAQVELITRHMLDQH